MNKRIFTQTHHVGKISLAIKTTTLESALQLRARAEEVAWKLIPNIIEEVFDTLAPAELHVRIDRLELDLGNITADALEKELPVAFERALHESLSDAIAKALHAPCDRIHTLSPSVALLEEFDTYLISGTLPFRSAANTFDPAEIIRRLITEQPTALTTLLRQRARDNHAIERLVLQAGEEGLRTLLDMLAPADAAVIFAYLSDFRRIHCQTAVAKLAEPVLRRTLWVLTLKYLLREAGTQFNRRSYLASLIEDVALAEGTSYETLLILMQTVAMKTRASQPMTGSLLSVLNELLERFQNRRERVSATSGRNAEAGVYITANEDLEHYTDANPQLKALTCAEAGNIEPLLNLLRRTAANLSALKALVELMSGPIFSNLIEQLQPTYAKLILAHVATMKALHHQQPQLELSESAFECQLRLLTLRYLLLDAGSQFNRLSWLRRLLNEFAQTAGVTYRYLLTSFTAALDGLRGRLPLSSSLPESLALLTSELTSQDDPDTREHEVIAKLLARLRDHVGDAAAIAKILQMCTTKQLAQLIEQIEPLHTSAILANITQLTQALQMGSLRDNPVTEQGIASMALHVLLTTSGPKFDRHVWLQHLLQELAEEAEMPCSDLVAALDVQSLATLTGRSSPAQSVTGPAATAAITEPGTAVAMSERFLRTGQPKEIGSRLSDLANADPIGFAALLRRLLITASGNAEALIEQLLIWMLPEEIAAILLPGQVDKAARWAAMLADLPGASMASAWTQVLDAALHERELSGPDTLAWPTERLDHLALLRQWIDQGTLPWWAAPDIRIDALLADLPRQTLAMLYTLFGDPEPERIVLRLRRMFNHIGTGSGLDIIARLAPWAFVPGGPLAAIESGLGEDALNDLRIRAAAAAIAGIPLDLDQLARPIMLPPDIPEQRVEPHDLSEPYNGSTQEESHLLFAWLAGVSGNVPEPSEKSYRLLADLLDQKNPALDAALREGLAQPNIRQRWAETMPEEILARLIYRLAPAQGRFMVDLKTVMQAAWQQTAPSGIQEPPGKRLWSQLLTMLAEEPTLPAPRIIAKQLLACLGNSKPVTAERLLTQAQWLAKQGGYANLTGALHLEAAKPQPQRTPPQGERRMPTPRSPSTQDGDTLYISNAGLVLCHPFLPHFFKQLELLSIDDDGVGRVIGIDNISRAVHLLQYLVNGRCDTPEPELALNKLLCGIALDVPVDRFIVPSVSDQAVCNDMIQAVIANWRSINNTSSDGLRETFLQRDGLLRRRDGKWTLTVPRKTVDVLVDQIPWGFAIIMHSWMPNELSVTW